MSVVRNRYGPFIAVLTAEYPPRRRDERTAIHCSVLVEMVVVVEQGGTVGERVCGARVTLIWWRLRYNHVMTHLRVTACFFSLNPQGADALVGIIVIVSAYCLSGPCSCDYHNARR